MVRIPAKLTNERREQVWALMLKGHNPQSIKKALNIPGNTVYKDIKFLTKKSKQYMYDMAKGLHVLSYQRAIEGIGLTLSEAWNKFHDPKVPEKQKTSYLRLTKECNEAMIQLTINGHAVLAVEDLRKRIERAGINVNNNNPILTEQEQIKDYLSMNRKYDGS